MADIATPTAAPTVATSQTTPSTETAKVAESTITAEDLAALAGEGESSGATGAKQEIKAAEAEAKDAKTPKEKAKVQEKIENLKRKYKLKVDGNEEDVELSDEEITKELQLAKKARKEIQTSSELKKELAQFLQMLKTDPARVLRDPSIGIDVKRFAEEILSKQLEEEMKSPEQKEKEKLEQELQELRDKFKNEEESRKTREYEAMVAHAEQDLEEKVQEALESSSLPKSPYILKRMADVMLSSLENKKDITPKQAINIVRKEMQKDLQDMFSASPEDILEELVGKDNLKRLNKRQLEKLKKSTLSANSIKDTGSISKKASEAPKAPAPKIKISDWLSKRG